MPRSITQMQKLEGAERWLAEASTLDEFKHIHDVALAAQAYAKARDLGLAAENHAAEIRLVAARRIGELVPATPPEVKGKRAHGKELSELRTTEISKQRLSEFRALAEAGTETELRTAIRGKTEANERATQRNVLAAMRGGEFYAHSDSVEWGTPQWLFDLLNDEFSFELDVCATAALAKCKKFFSPQDNGLTQRWAPRRCWMNPPYGRTIDNWMAKALEESRAGALVACLIPARTDTGWWWDNALHGEMRFIKGRLDWGNGPGPFPSAVVILSPEHKQKVVWWNIQEK